MATAVLATSSVNVNSTEQTFKDCVKAESDFSETKYHNICTGEVNVVPTGVYDYMMGIPLWIGLTFVVLFIIAAFLKFIFD